MFRGRSDARDRLRDGAAWWAVDFSSSALFPRCTRLYPALCSGSLPWNPLTVATRACLRRKTTQTTYSLTALLRVPASRGAGCFGCPFGKGQMGVSTKGVTALLCFSTKGPFGYSRQPTFIFPKVPGRTFFPNLPKFVTFAAAPLVLTPFVRNQVSAPLRFRVPQGEATQRYPADMLVHRKIAVLRLFLHRLNGYLAQRVPSLFLAGCQQLQELFQLCSSEMYVSLEG